VPGVTLSDGMAYEYAENKKLVTLKHNFEEDIIACAKNISARYMGSRKRSETIEKIALEIFDCMKKVHGLGRRQRLLLRISAILHDCGKYISMVNLGECSYNIIISTEIIGLSHMEREIVANVVKFNHSEFEYYEELGRKLTISREDYLTIAKLTAMLRLANGLDRSHKQKFGDMKVQIRGNILECSVSADEDITLEKGMLSARSSFFEEVFNVHPVIKQIKRV
jgi:exopolyphosphatase/guanosine-5'-triphosphate,3'-diphosphate pyrophosphatase